MTILEYEDQIRRQRYETALVWDVAGLLVLRKDGNVRSIEFSDNEVALMNKGVLTHNHPSGLRYPEDDPRVFGHSFSDDDICTACLAELAEIRAVTPKLRFSMKPPPQGWNSAFWASVILPCYSKHYDQVWEELEEAVFTAGNVTPAEADVRVLHETWRKVAGEVGLVYVREES